MIRFGIVDRLREQWLAALGLGLAVLALALGLAPSGAPAQATVLALRHAVPAGSIVRSGDVASVTIAAADRTPSMLESLGALAGRRTSIGLAGGDFVLRGALRSDPREALLRPGERAVALELAPDSVPDLRLLRAGRRVDIASTGSDGSHVVARGLELLAPASERAGGIVVTIRAPAAVALALTAVHGGRELRLLLRGEGA